MSQFPVSVQKDASLQSSSAEEVRVGEKLDMRWQCLQLRGTTVLGFHQKQHGHQTERADSLPLLCSCQTPLGVLHPAQCNNDVDLLEKV